MRDGEPVRVGVLALQGASDAHARIFQALVGSAPALVRAPADLEGLTHLTLPGGESTTLQRLMRLFGLWDAIAARHHRGELALFGTCAGAILLGRTEGLPQPSYGFLDVDVARNAYGRQVDSSVRSIELVHDARPFRAVFIRAPRFGQPGPRVDVLARERTEPLALAAPGLLATTFHPELTEDTFFHRRFLEMRHREGRSGILPACKPTSR